VNATDPVKPGERIGVQVPQYLAAHFPAFLANRRNDIDVILAALDKNDFEAIRILGHNMIGTGRLYGLELVTTVGPLIEQAALEHKGDIVKKYAGDLLKYLSSIVTVPTASGCTPNEPVSRSEANPDGKPEHPKLTALIVDDSEATREALALILKSASIHVVGQAKDGTQAIALCAALHPDLLFLDVIMPGLSGLEVLESIKGTSPGVKIVMVTSISDRKTVLQSKKMGAYDYILKPFDRADIADKLHRMNDTLVKKQA